jgi:hypothetical protein
MISPVDIDDISLTPLACPPVINCDFNVDMCGWTRDFSNQWIWDHGVGRVETGTTMKFVYPPRDHRSPLGMFMYTDFSKMPPKSTMTMILNSEFVTATPGSCFTFYYVTMTFDDTKNSFKIVLIDSKGNLKSISDFWFVDKFLVFRYFFFFGFNTRKLEKI